MEQISLESLNQNILNLVNSVESLKKQLIDDEINLEISDEVLGEIKESREMKGKDLVSHEEVMKKYLK